MILFINKANFLLLLLLLQGNLEVAFGDWPPQAALIQKTPGHKGTLCNEPALPKQPLKTPGIREVFHLQKAHRPAYS